MTRVNIVNNINEWEISLQGHANYAPKGMDIVCAGISLLTFMIAQILLDEAEDVRIYEYVLDQDKADVRFRFSALTDKVDNQLRAVVKGFELLGETYSDNIALSAKGV